ncbi:protein adenylyltransferase SelO [Pararhizobium haloflavum]|uniref:protein adenylyltransferase SelO n=1 Tax=Pararhizobium haloflavum TaxID=2037914 RepID=UPI000C18A4E3|nr:YdiU family protein [Pararhizobium haloflavum]
MAYAPHYDPSVRHSTLGEGFFDVVEPADFPRHTIRYRNDRAAGPVGLATLSDAEWIEHFARFTPLEGSLAQPLALRYHGHQFRQYNPDLGDGRGFLFAQLHDDTGRLLDLGTKGSGQTPWSRQGDGRLTLKGGVREVLATEMLEALGVNTSRSFSLIETGEALMRGDEPSPTRSSVLVRLSHSHIRIGTFQRLAYLQDKEKLVKLLDYAVATYMPDCERPDQAAKALAFLETVCRQVARTGAQWMAAGFVHGVLNTDNINITGESFDYGPWRFLPVLDPSFTAAYFDQTGLYAFGRQPETLFWNLARLAECLLPLVGQPELERVLSDFPDMYRRAFDRQLLARLGLVATDGQCDRDLAEAFWRFLAASALPFERVFFDWHGGEASAARAERSPHADIYAGAEFSEVRRLMAQFATRSVPDAASDYFDGSAPCTMLVDEVERIWSFIDENDDWTAFHEKCSQIAAMRKALGLEGEALG